MGICLRLLHMVSKSSIWPIRNHLNSILGFAEVLNNTKLNNEQKEYLEIIRTSGDTLIKISNDILDLSKIEAGQLMLNIHDFGLRQVIRDAVSTYEVEASKKGLVITTEISDKIPDIQRGDSTRLYQVLINLLGNAMKFTDKGEITLVAEPIRIGTEKDWIKISIKDTGKGMTLMDQPLRPNEPKRNN